MDSKSTVFFQRSLSTVILLALLGAAVSLDSFFGYAILISLLCNLTSYEWYRMKKDKLSACDRDISFGVGIAYPWFITYICCFHIGSENIAQSRLEIVSYMAGILIIYSIFSFIKKLFDTDREIETAQASMGQLGLLILSFIYPVWLFCFSFLFILDSEGIKILLWLILITKLSDIFAYICGVSFGRKFIKRPFSPVVSPKKSWEGIIGSFILTIVAAIILSQLFFSAIIAPLLLVPLFILAVTGDLAGSLIKRGLEVKDSGSLLPGIGGIFDLIDSPAFTVSLFSIIVIATSLLS